MWYRSSTRLTQDAFFTKEAAICKFLCYIIRVEIMNMCKRLNTKSCGPASGLSRFRLVILIRRITGILKVPGNYWTPSEACKVIKK